METDSLFYQLFQHLPETLFELVGLPAARAKGYRFGSVELKKALRVDGLFLPGKSQLPIYFVEVQFQRSPKFYANLFAKVFCYLEENDPNQEWVAVAIFPSRAEEPTIEPLRGPPAVSSRKTNLPSGARRGRRPADRHWIAAAIVCQLGKRPTPGAAARAKSRNGPG